jgi:Tol biopolymer transport system component
LTTPSRLAWVDRTGAPAGASTEVADYVNFRISPDGRRVAVTRVDQKSSTTDIWLLDVERNVQTRFTSHPGTDTSPVWSPDGTRIAFRSDRAGGNFPFERSSAADAPEQLLARVETQFLTDWSPDGVRLAFHGNTGVGFHVGVVQLAGSVPAQFIGQTTSTEIDGRFSPDGRWIAYSSDDAGQMEVYVAPFPRSGGRRVSTAGGSEPHWRRDGKELFYLAADRQIMSVAVESPGVFGVPQRLFQTDALFPGSTYHMNFDVNRDGTRFLVSRPVEGAGLSPITVVVNWLRLKPS